MKTYTREGVRKSLIHEVNHRVCICEQLRSVYDSVYKLPEGELKTELTEKLVDALLMAKKMGDRLAYYYQKNPDGTGHLGTNLKLLPEEYVQQKKKERRARQ